VDCDLILTQAVDVQLSQDHDTILKTGYDKLRNAGVSATRKAFYIDEKYAEQVSVAQALSTD
jgi:alkyl hydroperoxide reductase subunit AhpC